MPSAAEAQSHVASLNRRIREKVPEYMATSMPPVYIFNIHSMEHKVSLGSLGEFLVKACPEGQTYSEPTVVNGLVPDEFDLADGAGRMSVRYIQGADLAKDIVGIGSSNPNLDLFTTNREWWGVFIAAGKTPTKEELKTAYDKLTQMQQALLAHGDKLAAQGPNGIAQIGPMHRKAAQWLSQHRDWAKLPEKMKECPGCGEFIRPGAISHPSCGAILDWDKAYKLGMVQTAKPPSDSK